MTKPRCSYQNLKQWHIRVSMVKWDPELHTSTSRDAFNFVNSSLWPLSIFTIRFWSCCKVYVSLIATEQWWESVRGVSRLRSDQVLTMDECERIDERPQGMFYHGPTVGAKCSYQNLEQWHIRADMVEWGPEYHTSAWKGAFDRRGDLQNKGL